MSQEEQNYPSPGWMTCKLIRKTGVHRTKERQRTLSQEIELCSQLHYEGSWYKLLRNLKTCNRDSSHVLVVILLIAIKWKLPKGPDS